MFDQKILGTCVKFAIDGQQIMGLIYEKMKEAKSSIWIANYDLDPDLRLIRKADHQQSFQEQDLVTSSCQSESTAGEWYDNMFRNAKYNIYLEDKFPFQDKIITQILIKRLKEQPTLKSLVQWSRIFRGLY